MAPRDGSFFVAAKGFGRFVPPIFGHPIGSTGDPTPHFFFPLAGFESVVIFITSTEEMILLQSLLAKKVMDPSNFRDGDGTPGVGVQQQGCHILPRKWQLNPFFLGPKI